MSDTARSWTIRDLRDGTVTRGLTPTEAARELHLLINGDLRSPREREEGASEARAGREVTLAA